MRAERGTSGSSCSPTPDARPDDAFEVDAVIAHLSVYRRLLDAGARELGLRFERPAALVRTDDRLDLGRLDWAARLTSDGRNRFVASAIGIQLLPRLGAG